MTLPELRQNLKLLPGAPDESGAPRWLLFDVVRNAYFTLSRDAVDLVNHWQPGVELPQFVGQLSAKGMQFGEREVRAFLEFLIANHLVQSRSADSSDRIFEKKRAGQRGFWTWLLHNYLFIRIPLLRPDAWLARWTPRLNWLFSPVVHYLILCLGLLGVLAIIRRWEEFQATFLHFFNLEGLVLYGFTLVLVKSAHELGHAFAAKRLGCRVAAMGVAFLVLFPMLYTDTTDAWKLRSRRARLRIVTAGVRTELYLALIATFAWSVLPDGALRSAAFFVATTSWITSVLVNISPFLRFDGYYALSDLLSIENLQGRAFAFGRHRLRKLLWGLDDPLPEPASRARANGLAAFAWAVWIYRFFLFLGIALLVYHFFFKALGLLLMAVEIAWFIVWPMAREVRVWLGRRTDFTLSPWRAIGWGAAIVLLLWLVLPLNSSIHVPAVWRADEVRHLFAPESARVEAVLVEAGETVEQGQLLLQLSSPDLQYQLTQTALEIAALRTRLSRLAASRADKAVRQVNLHELTRLEERKAGLEARLSQLELRAPVAGRVVIHERLHPQRWVNANSRLLTLVGSQGVVEGFVSERDLAWIDVGQPGRFIPDGAGMAASEGRINEIDMGAVFTLPYAELSSEFGGHVAVRRTDEDRLLPEVSRFRITFMPVDPLAENRDQRLPGVIVVEGKTRSWLWHQLRNFSAALIRESGF